MSVTCRCSVSVHNVPARARGVLVYMQLMILVDGAGGEWPVIGHAPWNGCNLADFAMPFFLFIVGMAIPLSLKVRPSIPSMLFVSRSSMSASIRVPFHTFSYTPRCHRSSLNSTPIN